MVFHGIPILSPFGCSYHGLWPAGCSLTNTNSSDNPMAMVRVWIRYGYAKTFP